MCSERSLVFVSRRLPHSDVARQRYILSGLTISQCAIETPTFGFVRIGAAIIRCRLVAAGHGRTLLRVFEGGKPCHRLAGAGRVFVQQKQQLSRVAATPTGTPVFTFLSWLFALETRRAFRPCRLLRLT